jgi:glycosyltransferase involved in cell wall biosynthesis
MALASTILTRKPDLIYAYHPQATTGLIGIVMKNFRGVPFITDVQDLWPDALYATGLSENNLAMKVIDKWCNLIYKQSSRVVVLSNGFKNALIKRGVAERKIEVVYNWCPEESRISDTLSKTPEVAKETKKPASFIYAGNMGSAQSLKSLIKAVNYFDKGDLTLTLIGGGVEKEALIEYIENNNIDNVFVSNYIPFSEIFSKLNTADVLVVHLRNHPLFHITIPSKTQSSLAMRKPILMIVGGESNEIIKQAEAGVVAEPGNIDSMREAIQTLLSNRNMWNEWGKNGRKLYLKNFSIAINYERLNDVLKKVVN